MSSSKGDKRISAHSFSDASVAQTYMGNTVDNNLENYNK